MANKVWTDAQREAAAKALSKRTSAIWGAGGSGDEAAYRQAVIEQGCELSEAVELLSDTSGQYGAYPARRKWQERKYDFLKRNTGGA